MTFKKAATRPVVLRESCGRLFELYLSDPDSYAEYSGCYCLLPGVLAYQGALQ